MLVSERFILGDFPTRVVLLIYIDYWSFSSKHRILALWKIRNGLRWINDCDELKMAKPSKWNKNMRYSLGLLMKFKTLSMSDEEKHGHHFDLPLFF